MLKLKFNDNIKIKNLVNKGKEVEEQGEDADDGKTHAIQENIVIKPMLIIMMQRSRLFASLLYSHQTKMGGHCAGMEDFYDSKRKGVMAVHVCVCARVSLACYIKIIQNHTHTLHTLAHSVIINYDYDYYFPLHGHFGGRERKGDCIHTT